MADIALMIKISEDSYKATCNGYMLLSDVENVVQGIKNGTPLDAVLDEIRAEIEQLPTKTRTNWDGCCPDIDYPEIEYVDVTKVKLLEIIDKYRTERGR